MQTILTLCAIICALMFGISLALLKEKKISKKPWNVVFKIFVQIIGAAMFLCTFFSLSGQHHLFIRNAPLWVIAVISIAPIAIFSTIGNMITAGRENIRQFFQKGFKTLDKASRQACFLAAIVLLTGSLAIAAGIMQPSPTLLYPVMVLMLGVIITTICWVAFVICRFTLKQIFRFLKNFKNIGKRYWQWLTN